MGLLTTADPSWSSGRKDSPGKVLLPTFSAHLISCTMRQLARTYLSGVTWGEVGRALSGVTWGEVGRVLDPNR